MTRRLQHRQECRGGEENVQPAQRFEVSSREEELAASETVQGMKVQLQAASFGSSAQREVSISGDLGPISLVIDERSHSVDAAEVLGD